jgi:hypothetical protein
LIPCEIAMPTQKMAERGDDLALLATLPMVLRASRVRD